MTNTANILNDLPDIDAHPEYQEIPGLPGCYLDSSECERYGEEMTAVQIGPLYLSLYDDELAPLGRALVALAEARGATALPAPDAETIAERSR